MASNSSVEKRIERLAKAKREYYETGNPIMEDYEFDAEELILAREAPEAEILGAVGAPPEENVVKLPVPMPSLDKVKPGEPSWTRWLAKQRGEMIWSAKLDGISALWIPGENKLYNRGDGQLGSDLSRFIPIIAGLSRTKGGPSMVRGEILIKRAEAPSEAKIIRSWVNGILHRKEGEPLPPPGLLRFVAYRALGPKVGLAPMKEQFAALEAAHYELPPHGYFTINDSNRGSVEQLLKDLYQQQRLEGDYDIDGIVLSSATAVPEKPSLSNPKDTVAFKMALEEQLAETTVTKVEWNLSRKGILIPLIYIEPVTIGGATISKVTGHNAKFIVESGLGPGAAVIIRRSGDVIPIIDTVQVPVEAALPEAGTFTWDGVHIKPAIQTSGDPARQLLHSLKVLGVKGAGEAAAIALVEAGYLTIFDIVKAPMTTIQAAVGTAAGQKIKDGVAAAISDAPLSTQILTYPLLPAGLGASRIEAFVAGGANFDAGMPEGFGPQTWEALYNARKGINAWIAQFPAKPKAIKIAATAAAKGTVCLTGFRDADLKKRAEAAGWTVKDNLTKDCKYLIVPVLPFVSTKVDQATKNGIPIITKAAFEQLVK